MYRTNAEQRLYDARLHQPVLSAVCRMDINAKMHEGVSGRNMWMDCWLTVLMPAN